MMVLKVVAMVVVVVVVMMVVVAMIVVVVMISVYFSRKHSKTLGKHSKTLSYFPTGYSPKKMIISVGVVALA